MEQVIQSDPPYLSISLLYVPAATSLRIIIAGATGIPSSVMNFISQVWEMESGDNLRKQQYIQTNQL